MSMSVNEHCGMACAMRREARTLAQEQACVRDVRFMATIATQGSQNPRHRRGWQPCRLKKNYIVADARKRYAVKPLKRKGPGATL